MNPMKELFEQNSLLNAEISRLRGMKDWLPQNKKEEFSALVGKIEQELKALWQGKITPSTMSEADSTTQLPNEASPIAPISLLGHSPSIMIFESPAGKSEHPTTDHSSPNEFYCNEEE